MSKPSIGFGRSSTHDRDLAPRRFLHHVADRRRKGVEARADVLQIDTSVSMPVSIASVGRRVSP